MNRFSSKLLLITGFALCLIGGVFGCSTKVVQQFQRFPHQHLPAFAFEPLAKLQTVEYKLNEGNARERHSELETCSR